MLWQSADRHIIHRYTPLPLQEDADQDDARFDGKCTRDDRLSLHGFGAWWRETLQVSCYTAAPTELVIQAAELQPEHE